MNHHPIPPTGESVVLRQTHIGRLFCSRTDLLARRIRPLGSPSRQGDASTRWSKLLSGVMQRLQG